ncbi:uncharacterized protein LOC126828782 [Patella vulgata]|uniref:uncharacterized protein LOC126828782 n=1 Tax=Patella vulgata TaxID=6465 RepID=UPI00217FD41A|nr:uncharacterized protein LOC126828782 [Patella vulgata]
MTAQVFRTLLSIYYFICIVLYVKCQMEILQYCKPRVLAEEGDVNIAAIIAIHETGSNNCGKVSETDFQIAAAIRWTINTLNGNNNSRASFIPGVKIGYQIYDDCGLEMLSNKHLTDIIHVNEAEDCIQPPTPAVSSTPLLGIIGTSISQTTSSISRLLEHTKIPVVGIAATLPELSNKTLYPNFVRAIPSDTIQSKVILDMVKKLDWSYIVGIRTDDNYGREGFREFSKMAKQAGICISDILILRRGDSNMINVIETFIRGLISQINVTVGNNFGVVYFGHASEANSIFNTVRLRSSRWHNPGRFNSIQWIMSDGVGTSLSVAAAHKIHRNLLLSVARTNLELSEIRDGFLDLVSVTKFPNLTTEWKTTIEEYVRSVYKCEFSPSTTLALCTDEHISKNYHPYSYISSALDAIYILATALKAAQKQLCPNQIGICVALRSALDNNILENYKPSIINYSTIGKNFVPSLFFTSRSLIKDLNGDFKISGEPLYDINIAETGQEVFSKVGYYEDGVLNMSALTNKWTLPTQSRCKTICDKCLYNEDLSYVYIPGDVLILGLFPVHDPGNGYGCGGYRSTGTSFVSLLAFLSTLADLKTKTGINFGGIVLDDCYNPLRATNLLNMVFSRKKVLVDKISGTPIDISKIIAVVGAQSSNLAVSILPTLSNLAIPLISYSATSPDLDDRINYPYFLRTVPSDALQVEAILNVVKKLNVSHVSVINVNNNYGRKAVALFKRLAENSGICVENSLELAENELSWELTKTVNSLESNQARYVVFFGLNSIAINLLNAIGNTPAPVIFIASETWGRNVNVIEGGRGMPSRGSLTLSVQTSAVADNTFREYLGSLRQENQSYIPWINSFWQSTFQCNIPSGFDNRYGSDCSSNLKLNDATITQFVQDQRVVQTINAVTAAGIGYRNAIQDSCSVIDITKCATYIDSIKSASVLSTTGRSFGIFDQDSNGNFGFIVNNIQRHSDGSYAYVKVGSFGTPGLELDVSNLLFYGEIGTFIPVPESSCRFIPHCTVCLWKDPTRSVVNTIPPDTTKETPNNNSDNSLTPVVAVLAVLVTILMIFLGVVIFLILRNNVLKKGKSESTAREPPSHIYDTATESLQRRPSQGISLHELPRCRSSSQVLQESSDSSGVVTSRENDSDDQGPDVPTTYLSFVNGNPEIISVISGTSHYQTSAFKPDSDPSYLHAVQLASPEYIPPRSNGITYQQRPPMSLSESNSSLKPSSSPFISSSSSNALLFQNPNIQSHRRSSPNATSPNALLFQSSNIQSNVRSLASPTMNLPLSNALIVNNLNSQPESHPSSKEVNNTQSLRPLVFMDPNTNQQQRVPYTRTLSYVTGEQINPHPQACRQEDWENYV